MDDQAGFRERASISVIIPCYNSAKTILRALRSVIQQTVLPEAVFLVNDASSDNTLGIIKSFQAEHGKDWITVINLPQNKGPSFARNQAIKRVHSNYIAFLDADDSWHPQKLEIQYKWMLSNPEVILTGHKISLSNESVSENLQYSIRAKKITKLQILLSNPFSTPTVMMKSGLPYAFETGQHHAEDYLFWLRVYLNGGSIFRLEIPLAKLHKQAYGEAGLSQNLLAMEKGELQTYRHLYKSRHINLLQYICLTFYSSMKFIRRIILSGVSKTHAK